MDAVRFRLRMFLVLLFGVMVIGVLGFMITEGLSVVDAFYFSIVTIATVGYGDIHPATQTGKVLAIILIITGVGTFLGVVANATEMMLNRREKQTRLEKMSMIMGVFFADVGRTLLSYLSECDPKLDMIRKDLVVTGDWSEREFFDVSKRLKDHHYGVDFQKVDWENLRSFLARKMDLLMRLLENPTLLERESFTQLLRAVFHLSDELANREDLSQLPDKDYEHLAGDMKRVYALLVDEWLNYMKHLKDDYPYLFSLAVRTNPFDRDTSAVVK